MNGREVVESGLPLEEVAVNGCAVETRFRNREALSLADRGEKYIVSECRGAGAVLD
jgi:hypothetical protein